jgi:putative transposase
MNRTRYPMAQIVAVLEESKAGASTRELSRRHGISEQSVYRWKAKFAGMDAVRIRRLSSLEDENRNLKRTVAELTLDVAALKGVLLTKC